MKDIKTLGVLTSGGDCAGLNAVIRAVTYHANRVCGWRVLGVLDGSLGLMEKPPRYRELHADSFDEGLLREGGTFLGTTNKGDPFRFPQPDGSFRDRSGDFAAGVRELGLDALVVIGGDGSMRILSRLCEQAGIGMVGVPKTIDNDVHGTEYAVGFASAINVVTDALDRLQPTAASHHRVMILETMGRDAGHIALNGGIAGGADVILVPELPYTLDGLVAHLRRVLSQGRSHALLVVAEGVKTEEGKPVSISLPGEQLRYGGVGYYLEREISRRLGAETRVTVLGHLQRGGTPSPRDRLLASAFGVHAVRLVAERRFSRMVAWQDRGVVDVPLSAVTVGSRLLQPDDPLIATARGVGTYIGDV
ncbi:6-phosphofructokinase [Solimonas fluminis]|uniref:ATP-dependent 6-phosphofructokinase n=1 Tax=Solimonas fluminis TaxID=2086571 RepID=A0A2S5TGG0_9GAMM|nr:ATP-dependent 6-phosphofructokinase [Solimonas fluminis]PPE74045.1 6-phosphofructokinase [Solimonas fluminis]